MTCWLFGILDAIKRLYLVKCEIVDLTAKIESVKSFEVSQIQFYEQILDVCNLGSLLRPERYG